MINLPTEQLDLVILGLTIEDSKTYDDVIDTGIIMDYALLKDGNFVEDANGEIRVFRTNNGLCFDPQYKGGNQSIFNYFYKCSRHTDGDNKYPYACMWLVDKDNFMISGKEKMFEIILFYHANKNKSTSSTYTDEVKISVRCYDIHTRTADNITDPSTKLATGYGLRRTKFSNLNSPQKVTISPGYYNIGNTQYNQTSKSLMSCLNMKNIFSDNTVTKYEQKFSTFTQNKIIPQKIQTLVAPVLFQILDANTNNYIPDIYLAVLRPNPQQSTKFDLLFTIKPVWLKSVAINNPTNSDYFHHLPTVLPFWANLS